MEHPDTTTYFICVYTRQVLLSTLFPVGLEDVYMGVLRRCLRVNPESLKNVEC